MSINDYILNFFLEQRLQICVAFETKTSVIYWNTTGCTKYKYSRIICTEIWKSADSEPILSLLPAQMNLKSYVLWKKTPLKPFLKRAF